MVWYRVFKDLDQQRAHTFIRPCAATTLIGDPFWSDPPDQWLLGFACEMRVSPNVHVSPSAGEGFSGNVTVDDLVIPLAVGFSVKRNCTVQEPRMTALQLRRMLMASGVVEVRKRVLNMWFLFSTAEQTSIAYLVIDKLK